MAIVSVCHNTVVALAGCAHWVPSFAPDLISNSQACISIIVISRKEGVFALQQSWAPYRSPPACGS